MECESANVFQEVCVDIKGTAVLVWKVFHDAYRSLIRFVLFQNRSIIFVFPTAYCHQADILKLKKVSKVDNPRFFQSNNIKWL